MKFRIKTESLKKGLDIVNHATASITTTPILENILLEVLKDSIMLTSNNLEMAIKYVINDEIEIKIPGSFCIPSKILTSYIGLINDEYVEIGKQGEDSIKINTETSKIKIKGFNPSDFPLIPQIKEEISLNLKGNVLKKSIEKTLFSTAEGNIRPTLAGILVNINSKEAVFASTDSFRLSEYKVDFSNPDIKEFTGIIPSKTASQIKNILNDADDVKILSGENQIVFIFGNTKLYSRLLNGKFPEYKNFFPLSYNTKSEINRIDLISALKKINLISRENNYSIKMSFSAENEIFLETSETQIGEGNTTLVGVVEGENNIIGINSIYFLEVLGVIETTHISISFETPLSPILIRPLKDEAYNDSSSFKHIIMPLKI